MDDKKVKTSGQFKKDSSEAAYNLRSKGNEPHASLCLDVEAGGDAAPENQDRQQDAAPSTGKEKPLDAARSTGKEKLLDAAPSTGNEKPLDAAPSTGNEKPLDATPSTGNKKPLDAARSTGNDKPLDATPSTGNKKPLDAARSIGNEKPLDATPSTGNKKPLDAARSTGNEKPLVATPSTGNKKTPDAAPSTGNEKPQDATPSTGNKKPLDAAPSTGNEKPPDSGLSTGKENPLSAAKCAGDGPEEMAEEMLNEHNKKQDELCRRPLHVNRPADGDERPVDNRNQGNHGNDEPEGGAPIEGGAQNGPIEGNGDGGPDDIPNRGFQKAWTASKDLVAGISEECGDQISKAYHFVRNTTVGAFFAAVWAFLVQWMIRMQRKFIKVCNKLWENRWLILKVVGGIMLSLLFFRIIEMVAETQNEVQNFEEFVEANNAKYQRIIREQNSEVDGLHDTADELKEQLKAVETASRENMTGYTGEIAEIKKSIVNVKNDFEEFMVQSQAYMINVQDNMHKEVGKIQGDVNAVRDDHKRIKHSLDSIEYNIRNMKNCGLLARLFGYC